MLNGYSDGSGTKRGRVSVIETNLFATVTQMAGGYCLARSLHVVANLGVGAIGALLTALPFADALNHATQRRSLQMGSPAGFHPPVAPP